MNHLTWEDVYDLFEKMLTEYVAQGGNLKTDSIRQLREWVNIKRKEYE